MSSRFNPYLPRSPRVLLIAVLVIAGTGWAAGGTKGEDETKDSSGWTVLSNALAYANAEDVAYLGVQLDEEVEHAEGGARVREVVAGSPADEAGLQEGDLIQRFDGTVVRGPVGLTEKIHARKPGDEVEIVLLRDGKKVRLPVELGQRRGSLSYLEPLEKLRELRGMKAPGDGVHFFDLRSSRRPRLGVQLVETTSELRRHLGGDEHRGVLVSKVLSGTPAEQADIRVGDLIVTVDGTPVATSRELVSALRELEGTFVIELVRDRKPIEVQATFADSDEEAVPTGPRASNAPASPVAPPVRVATTGFSVTRPVAPTAPAAFRKAASAPGPSPVPRPSVVVPAAPAAPAAPEAPPELPESAPPAAAPAPQPPSVMWPGVV